MAVLALVSFIRRPARTTLWEKLAFVILAAFTYSSGLRAPVQVIDGNYKLMSGTCAWWDGVKG